MGFFLCNVNEPIIKSLVVPKANELKKKGRNVEANEETKTNEKRHPPGSENQQNGQPRQFDDFFLLLLKNWKTLVISIDVHFGKVSIEKEWWRVLFLLFLCCVLLGFTGFRQTIDVNEKSVE